MHRHPADKRGMPDLDFLAAAYENGQILGRAFRWMLLLAIGFSLVIRMARGSFGPGFRRSRLGTAVSLVAVAVCLVGSLHYDFVGHASAEAGRDMTAARAEVVRGCLDQGQLPSVCDCYGDEVLRRIDRSPKRFAALERDMISRQNAGQGPPELIMQAAQACAGQAG